MLLRSLLLLLSLTCFSACGPPSEEIRVRYAESKSLRFRGTVRVHDDGLRTANGIWSFWFPGGQMQAEGRYVEGSVCTEEDLEANQTRIPLAGRTGLWKGWYRSGDQAWLGEYRNGKRQGEWRWWHAGGRESQRGMFIGGLEHGRHQVWHEDGTRASEGEWNEGNREGLHRPFPTHIKYAVNDYLSLSL